MNRLNDLRPLVDAVFRQRMEEIIAIELVTELGGRRRRGAVSSKPRFLVLCRPLAPSSGASSSAAGVGCTVNIATPEKDGQRVKVRQAFLVERLRDTTHDGSYDATLNFGASGLLSVSFESNIQREMFLAAVRRQQEAQAQRQVGRRAADGPGMRATDDLANIRGVLSAAVGAEVEADAASRVRRLRQEKRRVFSVNEEQHLLAFMGRSSFDDVRGFQEVLLGRQKEAELSSIDSLVKSAAQWDSTREQILGLVHEVEDLEGRMEDYSAHLMAKKGVIQHIEHANNTLRQKQVNLEKLYVLVAELREQLSLSPQTVSLLTRLRTVPDEDLAAFFSDGQNAVLLSEAMRHMHMVLRNPRLDADYPIAAVSERKTFFLEQRKLIARRSHAYILALIQRSEESMLADRTRYSKDERLVWRLHEQLSRKLLSIADIVAALPRIDPERFTSTLRKYRTSMQKVYALEVYRFLKGIRRQVKRVSTWRGPFLLGSSGSREDALAARMETAQAGETPRMWRGTSSPSPALTPRAMGNFDDDSNSMFSGGGGGGGSSRGGRSGSTMLSIEFPSGAFFGADVALYASTSTLRRLDARAASASVTGSLKALTVGGGSGGGHLRPDLAFAIVLESAVIAVLHEEHILRQCFGIGAADAAGEREDGTEAVKDGAGGAAGGSGASRSNRSLTDGRPPTGAAGSGTGEEGSGADRGTATAHDTEAAALILESLLELFGGDGPSPLGLPGAAGSGAADPSPHSRSTSRDLGLPPRYPVSPRGANALSVTDFYGAAAASDSRASSPLSAGDAVGVTAAEGSWEDEASHRAFASLSPADLKRIRGNFIVREVSSLVQFLFDKCDRIYAIPALCMVKAYRLGKKPMPSRSPFCQGMLRELETITAGAMLRFVAEQTESISACRKRYLVKPTALLHCFARMPALILRMEAVHNALADDVCDRTEYASIVTSLIDQSFEALDILTGVKVAGTNASAGDASGRGASSSSSSSSKLKLNEQFVRRVHYALEGISGGDPDSQKRMYIQQYRHHAFFCAFFATLPPTGYAATELLHDYWVASKSKRDRYEELYLTRVLLVKEFPSFGAFALTAEDLAQVYSQEELRHHRALAAEAVKKVVEKLEKEMRSGVRSSAQRMKRHFLRDVDAGSSEESFHTTLLQRTWQHFGQLILQKYDFVGQLLRWPMYQGTSLPITRQEVSELLASF